MTLNTTINRLLKGMRQAGHASACPRVGRIIGSLLSWAPGEVLDALGDRIVSLRLARPALALYLTIHYLAFPGAHA